MREYRFDVVRVVCMTYIVTYVHLEEYIYPQGRMTFYFPACIAMTHACLGLFTFISGYLLGSKYCFGRDGNCDVWTFYKKRLLRLFPLFVVASILLWLIDFNDTEATWNGLLCISPFVNPKPRTMYYIPIILWCCLVTPLISRHGLKRRVFNCLLLMTLLLLARFIFPSIDNRFVFNVFFFFVGVVSASCFDWKLNTTSGMTIKIFVVVAFVLLMAVALHYSLLSTTFSIMAFGAIGVFVIFFICEGISNLGGHRFFYLFSYATMACYLFHRFFYWLAEIIWNPSDTSVKWVFMVGVVFPVIVVTSYVIQKIYDYCVIKSHLGG